MSFFHALLWAIPLIACAQPPAIDQEGVRNAASRMPPSLPGGAIAPGAAITIGGLRLGGGISAVRVHIRQRDADREARVISASPDQIEALMPRQVQPGDAQLVVTRDGVESRPFPLRIARAAFGIATCDREGHPGARATIRGTGLGTARDVEVFVGEKRASRVVWRGPGRDRAKWEEIRFELARDTPPGCSVPVVVKAGDHVSNAVTMSVTRNGEPCSEAAPPDALILLARLRMHVQLSGGAPVDFAEDVGAAGFSADLRGMWRRLPPSRMCTAYSWRWTALPSLTSLSRMLAQSTGSGRDAGPGILVAGPRGESLLGSGFSSLRANGPAFLEPGDYRISGRGGSDVGEFTAVVHADPMLERLNPELTDTIDRARGFSVEWRGATARQQVIVAAASVDPLSGAAGICLCNAPGEAGRRQVPPLWLANLPASQDLPGVPLSYLFLATLPAEPSPRFHASGVSSGIAIVTTVLGRTVKYK